jgi:hypothetical protein
MQLEGDMASKLLAKFLTAIILLKKFILEIFSMKDQGEILEYSWI